MPKLQATTKDCTKALARTPRKKHAREGQAFIRGHNAKAVAHFQKELEPHNQQKVLDDLIDAHMKKYQWAFRSGGHERMRALGRRFVELHCRTEMPKTLARLEKEKEDARKRDAEVLANEARIRSMTSHELNCLRPARSPERPPHRA